MNKIAITGDFVHWYIKWMRKQRTDYDKFSDAQILSKFKRKPWAEKWGVFLQYFDGKQYELTTVRSSIKGNWYYMINHKVDQQPTSDTREEAQIAGVEKLFLLTKTNPDARN